MEKISIHILLSVVIVFILIAGCAAPVTVDEGPAMVYDDESWKRHITAPPEMTIALSQAKFLYISSDGSDDIPVRVYGEEGERTPVIMAHGLQSHSGWFAQSAAFIAGLGHPVYAMDRRGSGLSRSRRGDMKDFNEMVRDIRTVVEFALEKHARQRVLLLGHCFGAIPMTAYASTYPDTVKGLILTTPAIYTKTTIPLYEQIRIVLTRSGRRDYMVPVPLDPGWFTELEEYGEFIGSDPLSLKQATGDFYYEIHRARKFIHRNTEKLTMPVFMGIAKEDPICDNRGNKKFFRNLPTSHRTLAEYGEARHILEFSSEKETFFMDIKHWLKRFDRS